MKLNDISKDVISNFSTEKIYEYAYSWASRYDEELKNLLEDKEYSCKVLGIERSPGIKKRRKDISKWSELKDNVEYMYDNVFLEKHQTYPYQVINNSQDIAKILKLYIEQYYNPDDDKETWFNRIKDLSEKIGYAREVKEFKNNPGKYSAHVGDVSTVIRVALTGRTNTPDLYEIMKVLGKNSILKRFVKALDEIKLDENSVKKNPDIDLSKEQKKQNDDMERE